jgi:GxxExxY protein
MHSLFNQNSALSQQTKPMPLELGTLTEQVVELKAIKALEDVHFAQVRSYLRATGLKHGLLINFATLTLTVKRVL